MSDYEPGEFEHENHAAESPRTLFSLPTRLMGAIANSASLIFPPELGKEGVIDPEIQHIVQEENEMIEARSSAHKSNLLRFDEKRVGSIPVEMQHAIFESYLKELDNRKSLLDKFALFMDERYFDYTYTLDLAETTEAASHKAINDLKEQYFEVRDMLVRRGTIAGEIPRDSAEIKFFARKSAAGSKEYSAVERTRKLFEYRLKGGAAVVLSKRMTFLYKSTDDEPFALETRDLLPHETQIIQSLVDQEDEEIVPVRTVYFVTKKFPKN